MDALPPLPPLEAAKRAAARRAVDDYVRDGMRIGVGSGSTIVYAVQRLGERAAGPERLRVTCVPTSFQSRGLILDAGLTLSDLTATPSLDVAIDGADEVASTSLACIKGGGGCQTQEKLVAAAADVFVVVADSRKMSRDGALGVAWTAGVPVEVLPLAYATVSAALRKLGGIPTLRMAVRKAGPVVTDNAGFVLDVDFGRIADPAPLHAAIKALPGVIETGLFVGLAKRAYFGMPDGSVEVWESERT